MSRAVPEFAHYPLLPATVEARRHPHWVYRTYDASGRLLYVGMSRDPRQRLKTWRSVGKDWSAHWTHRTAVTWLVKYSNWKEAARAERYAIQTEDPLENRAYHERAKRPTVMSILDVDDDLEQVIRAAPERSALRRTPASASRDACGGTVAATSGDAA